MNNKTIAEKLKARLGIDEKRLKIAALKAKLSATDYKAIKYAEGIYTDEQYAVTKAERESIRARIRNLEGE
jgi:hypothetical protein